MENKACVYALRHNVTKKTYVGCSRNVRRRIHQHLVALKSGTHTNKMMQEDYDRYGLDYSYYILFEAYASYDAFLMEKHFMSLLKTRDPSYGYNVNDNSNDFSLDDYTAQIIHSGKTCEDCNTEQNSETENDSDHKSSDAYVLANNLKEIRESRGMTQVELSKASRVSRYTIIKIENGVTNNVRIKTMENISNALRADMNDVFPC